MRKIYKSAASYDDILGIFKDARARILESESGKAENTCCKQNSPKDFVPVVLFPKWIVLWY